MLATTVSAHNLCPVCQSPLLARYDLARARETLTLESLQRRSHSMWRYEEVLPAAPPVTLGEGATPLIRARRLGAHLGLDALYIKEEGQNPTGSFKARGLSAAVTMAKALGVDDGRPSHRRQRRRRRGRLRRAARGCAAWSRCRPTRRPPSFWKPAPAVRMFASSTGSSRTAGPSSLSRRHQRGWYEVSTLKEPYRIEGKKTMGYELWEEFGGTLPDVIVYPTGGGVGLIGMWKAFEELEAMGLTGSASSAHDCRSGRGVRARS